MIVCKDIKTIIENLIPWKVTNSQISDWLNHLKLLRKWNNFFNMTSVTDFDEMLVKHLFDSLSASSFITGRNIADIGSGGGLPGIPLSILFPNKKFTLIESNTKKILFLKHVKNKLKLKNVKLVNVRIENHNVVNKYDQIISRALYSSILKSYQDSFRLLGDSGQLILMKGKFKPKDLTLTEQELATRCKIYPVTLPNSELVRNIVLIKK